MKKQKENVWAGTNVAVYFGAYQDLSQTWLVLRALKAGMKFPKGAIKAGVSFGELFVTVKDGSVWVSSVGELPHNGESSRAERAKIVKEMVSAKWEEEYTRRSSF